MTLNIIHKLIFHNGPLSIWIHANMQHSAKESVKNYPRSLCKLKDNALIQNGKINWEMGLLLINLLFNLCQQ